MTGPLKRCEMVNDVGTFHICPGRIGFLGRNHVWRNREATIVTTIAVDGQRHRRGTE
jgi:hypothetical protein